MSDMTSGGGKITTEEKEMGITHADFYKELAVLLNGTPCRQREDGVLFEWQGKGIEITLGPEGVRKLGPSIRLPATRVTLRFFAFTEDDVQEFIRRFNLRFMKGGG